MARSGKIAYDIEFNVKNENLKNIKQELNSLIGSLQKIQQNAAQAKILGSLDKELEMAAKEAEKLSGVINSSWNVKLNQLNLTKFEQNIKNSYGSLEQLRVQLNKIGQGGTFNKLANEILGTNLQLKTTSSLLDKMSVTFANTIRYGISSRVFNNFASSISKAYDYVKDLDTSLNSIRKVSNASADDMARFAKYANQSAQAMGKSTLDYTKGALIYYQQGLGEEEVKKRTDITMKMSNVLGTSADEVSNYMTAIWNNFDDGSKSLEYFADVLTKLGATTASSSEEIATGLEKFSAIGKTVGLSYEYAAAALATVTATTRQSADTVGTAFKTLFARIQGLKLGETLDDGTTLNKYSEALNTVGVSIKDQSGNLKDMDKILDEMGAKWQTLDTSQQTALAQTVAGVRQYSQLMALMNNWDFFKENLSTANNATGELQRQQEIYLESMEAHLEKFRTETERTYAALFDEKSVSSLADIATKALSKINDVIEGLGGGLNSVINLAAQLAVVFHKQLGSSLLRTFDNLKLYWKENVQSVKIVEDTIKQVQQQSAGQGFSSGTGMNTAYVQEQAETVEKALKYRKGLTEEQYNEIVNDAKDLALLKQKRDYLEQIKRISEEQNDVTTLSQAQKDYKSLQTAQKQASDVFKQLNKSITEIENSGSEDENQAHYDQIKQTVQDILDLKYQIAEVDDASFLTEVQKKELTEIAKRLEEDELLTDKDKETLDGIALQSKTYYIAKLQEQKELMEAIAEDEQKVTEETNLQISQLEKKNAANLENGKRQAIASQSMQTFSATIQGLTAITGAISSMTDANADGAQKANAAWQGVFGTGSAIANAILPGSGFIVQGIGSIGKSILEATGLWEGFEDLFKSSEEKLKEIREELEKIKKVEAEATSKYADNKNVTDYLNSIKTRFNQLQSLAEKGLLTDDLRSEYETYLDKVQQYNKDLVITYDEQGKKIAANSDIILKTIGLIQEENELLIKQTYTDENWKKFTEQKEKEYKASQKLYNEKQDEINTNAIRSNRVGTWAGDQYDKNNIKRSIALNEVLHGFGQGYNGKNLSIDNLLNGKKLEDYDLNLDEAATINRLWNQNKLEDSQHGGKEWNNYLNGLSNEEIKELWEKANKLYWDLENRTKETDEAWQYYYNKIMSGALDINESTKNNELAYAKKSTIGSFSVDTGRIFNEIKNNPSVEGAYDAYKELGIENADGILLSYIEGLNFESDQFKDSNGIIDYEKIKDHIVTIQKNIYEALQGDPELIQQINDINAFEGIGLSSEEYERALQTKIEEFLSGIETQSDFNKIKNLLPTLFNLKSVSAQWKDGKAQLGANGGNIVTQGEAQARSIGKTIAEFNVDNEEDKDKVAEQIEKYLQDTFTETDLTNVDTTKFTEDFNNLLARSINPETGEIDQTLTELIQKTMNAQNIDSVTSDIDKTIASKDSEIKKYDLDTTELKQYSKYLTETATKANDLANSLKEDGKAATIVAKSTMRMNKGVESLSNNFKEWNSVLKKSKKSSQEYNDALQGTKKAVANILDVEEDAVSNNFVEKHLKDIEGAAKGNEKAIDNLRKEYTKDIVLKIAVDNDLDKSEQKQLINSLQNLQAEIPNIKVGTSIDFTQMDGDYGTFIQRCNDIVASAHMTADQAREFFSSMGFEAEFETESKPVVKTGHGTRTVTELKGSMSVPMPDGTTMKVPAGYETKTYPGEPYTYVDYVDVVAMTTDGSRPKIKSITKKATGSMNNYSSTNKGGGSSGGNKGGSGSSAKPKKEKEIKETADRYHKVNTQITKIDKQLDKVQSKQKKLVGGELIKNLNQQWELLNTQIENYNKKLAIANKEQEELAEKLSGQGVKFNEDGTVSNYEESLKAAQERYNKQVKYYNSLTKSQQDKLDEKYEDYGGYLGKFKQEYEQFKSDIDRYDEIVVNVKPEIDKQALDALDKQIEINIQKFNLKLTVTVDMNQATRDWNAWKKKVIDGIKKDDILGNSKARAADFSTYFNKNGLGDVQVKSDQVNKILTELDKMDKGEVSSVYGYKTEKGEIVNDRAKALEELKEKYTDLMETMSDELELEEELYQNILDEMDKVQEKFDEQIKSYEFLRDMINHDIKVIQMVYGEDSYSDLAKFYDKQQENYENQLDFQRQQKDFWYAQMQAAEEGSEEWKKAKENWMNAVNQFNQKLEEGLENAKNKFENTINDIFQNLNNTITGGLGLDYVQKEWELINKNADRYLDTVNATYGIHSLERKYIDAINKSNDINVQQKLKKIMDEQVSNLKDRDRLTQYELDRANKLYDIELARVTLEEAQMNKSQMRLRRDSQGNYTYQYVANDEKIREAEQKLEDLYNQLYNFDKDRYNEVLNDAYNAWDEYQQKMRDAEIQYVHDEEELEKQKFLIQSQYDELIAQIEQDYQVSRTNLAKSLFTGLAASTATSLAETNTSYGIALTDAQGKTKIAFDLMSDTINEAFVGADTISSETFKKITEAAQKAGLTIDGYTSTSFNAIMEGFDSLEPKEKEALADQLIPTWNNGVSDMVKYFINGGDDKGGMKAIEDTFSGKISSMQTLFSGADGKGGFVKTVKDGWNKIDTAQNTYKTDLGKLETAAGTTFKKIKDGENGVYNQIDPLIKKNDELIDKYAEELGAVQLVYAETMKLKEMFDKQAESAKKAAEEAYNYYVKEKELEAKTVENMPETKTSGGNGGNNNSGGDTGGDKGGDTGGGNPPSPQGNGKVDTGDYVTINSSYASYAGGKYISNPAYKKGSKLYVQSIYNKDWVHVGTSTDFSNRKTWVGWIRVKDISGYDTGGYTGSWGKSGRLAMLHEKELVLNAKDTENMLNTVAIMRGLTYSLGSNMLSRLAGATASGYSGSGSGNDGILEQNVHIDATFPNVKNATEIEEALNNLVNAASQRAYERR